MLEWCKPLTLVGELNKNKAILNRSEKDFNAGDGYISKS
jgi:hypothetical protein